jgi:hypothetical protein
MIENNRYYWSHLKTKTVTVRVSPKNEPLGIIYKVSSMIDVGRGRQTVVLEHFDAPANSRPVSRGGKALPVPLRMGSFDFVYTSRQVPAVRNIGFLTGALYNGAKIERIVPDVLCPGDLLVFKQGPDGKLNMIDALRIVKESTYVQNKAGHAV